MPVVDSEQSRAAEATSPVQVGGPGFSDHPLGRVYFFSAVLLAEYLAIDSVPHPWCSIHRAVAAAIVFLAVFLVVVRSSLKSDRTPLPLNLRFLPVYGASLLVIALSHAALLLTTWSPKAIEIVWFAAIPFSAAVLLCVFIPHGLLPSLLRRTGTAWLYAAIACTLVVVFTSSAEAIWDAPTSWGGTLIQRATFHMVGRVLQLFYSYVSADPATYTIDLQHFGVTIAASCSGIEGLCLTLMFSVGWLWFARRELRFPQALLLVPCALALSWILNILRIAALLMIGNSGHPDVALHGFHSEAGWISFNVVTLGFLLATNHIPWLSRTRATAALDKPATRNVAAIYLLPFLAILAAAFFTKAASSGFEWAYPLRFIAAVAALWFYREEYRRIDWSFTWRGPSIGALVFAMWLGLSHWTSGSVNSSMPAALSAMPRAERISWLIIRITAAVITVPVAEELAFRGFFLRQIVSADVESVAYRAVTPMAILVSSIAFGVMHGKLWLAGIVAGIAYALVLKRTGRLGEAVAAHSTTNLLLAVWVLIRGDWGLW
jgi:exosortase E/protease (VPEID-CTERM system)